MMYECPICKGRLLGTVDNCAGSVVLGDMMIAGGTVKCSDCGKLFEISQHYFPVSDYELKEVEEE